MNAAAVLLAFQAAMGSPAASERPADYPFAVGEHLRFAVKMGMLRVGTGTMTVAGLDTVRGIESLHFVFELEGGIPGFRLQDRFESWTGRDDLISRRFYKDIKEGSYERAETFDIYPDSGHYRINGNEARPTPSKPLDDTSFFYFVRTVPLEVGQTYVFDRYYDDAMNPLVLKVEKREKLKLPDGTKVECLVLHPVMGEQGLLAKRSKARVWLTDDARRLPVQIRSSLPFGTLTLKLESIGSTGA